MTKSISSSMHARLMLITVVLFAVGAMTGCASSSSVKAKPLKTEAELVPDLSGYDSVTVLPFKVSTQVDASVGATFADNVARRLQTDFGPLFNEVQRADQAQGHAGELVITGRIDKYKKGSRVARAMLIGVGRASLQGELELRDGRDGVQLMTAPISKLWAWGGLLGATKGIEDMVAESEAAVAATVARTKGWDPEG